MKKKFFILPLVLASLSFASETSEYLKAAKKAYKSRDYKKAYNLYKKACGYKQDTNKLKSRQCDIIGRSIVTSYDQNQAYRFAKKECGTTLDNDACSIVNILEGLYFRRGAIFHLYPKVAKVYKKACEAGNAKGCLLLGNLYFYGRGVKKSHTKALELYKKACEKGNKEGCEEFAELNKAEKKL